MCPLLSVRFYSFYFFIRFSMNIFFPKIPLRWWAQVDSNHRPRAYQARALTTWAMSPLSYSMYLVSLAYLLRLLAVGGDDGIRTHDPLLAGQVLSQLSYTPILGFSRSLKIEQLRSKHIAYTVRRLLVTVKPTYDTIHSWKCIRFSIERRWSSRTFRYGYLVTT